MHYLINLIFGIPHAHAYTYFDFGEIASGTMAFAGQFLGDLSPLLMIILGALVIGLIIALIFGAFHKK